MSNQEIFAQKGAGLVPQEVVGALCADAHPGAYSGQDAYTGRLVPCFSNDPAATICANEAKTYTNEGSVFQLRNVIAEPIATPTYGIPVNWIGRKPENGGNQVEPMDNISPCLTKTDRHGVVHPESKAHGHAAAIIEKPSPITFQETADCLTASYGTKWNGNASADNGSLFAGQPMETREVCPTLTSKMQGSSGWAPYNETEHILPVAQPIGFGMDGDVMHDNCMETITTREGAISDTSHAVAQLIPFGVSEQMEVGHCLRSGASRADKHESTTYVAEPIAVDVYNFTSNETTTQTLRGYSSPEHMGTTINPAVRMAVRRLTPVECERLQGFPDNFTRIPWRNKPAEQCPDGPRYKALGNSMAVPVMRWIGERIQQFEEVSK
jgi:hypothetical protein